MRARGGRRMPRIAGGTTSSRSSLGSAMRRAGSSCAMRRERAGTGSSRRRRGMASSRSSTSSAKAAFCDAHSVPVTDMTSAATRTTFIYGMVPTSAFVIASATVAMLAKVTRILTRRSSPGYRGPSPRLRRAGGKATPPSTTRPRWLQWPPAGPCPQPRQGDRGQPKGGTPTEAPVCCTRPRRGDGLMATPEFPAMTCQTVAETAP